MPKDWRSTAAAAAAAADVLVWTDELCQVALSTKPEVQPSPSLTIQLMGNLVNEFFSQARHPGTMECKDPLRARLLQEIDVGIKEEAALLAKECGASNDEVLLWMQGQFSQAFKRVVAQYEQ